MDADLDRATPTPSAAAAGPTADPTESSPDETASGGGFADDPARHDVRVAAPAQLVGYQEIDDMSVRVFFLSGDMACAGAYPIVIERAKSIGIAVQVGRLPEGQRTCPLTGRQASLVVHLDDELGKRRITDSAGGELERLDVG